MKALKRLARAFESAVHVGDDDLALAAGSANGYRILQSDLYDRLMSFCLRDTHSLCLYVPLSACHSLSLPLYPSASIYLSACVPLTLPTSVPLRDSLFASTLQRGEGPPPNALQAVMAGWGPGNLQVFVSIYLSIYQSIYIPYTI